MVIYKNHYRFNNLSSLPLEGEGVGRGCLMWRESLGETHNVVRTRCTPSPDLSPASGKEESAKKSIYATHYQE